MEKKPHISFCGSGTDCNYWYQGRLIRLFLNNEQNFTVMQDKTI